MRTPVFFAVMLAVGLQAPTQGAAEERYFNFALKGGLDVRNDYPGSSGYKTAPALNLTFGALRWGAIDVGNGIGVVPDNGLALGGAFNVRGSRAAAENPELAGLTDIDAAIEVGVNLTYRESNWLVFGEVRQGFGGHEGVVGTLGGDLVFRPTERLTVTAGPRLNFGDADFAQTYFGVSAADAGRSAYGAYDADGGLLGLGFQVGATYELDERWAVEGAVRYERLKNDAATSPITAAGSEDQWSVNIGLSRAFTLRF